MLKVLRPQHSIRTWVQLEISLMREPRDCVSREVTVIAPAVIHGIASTA